MIFDTHAHYDDEAFDDDREQLLERMSILLMLELQWHHVKAQ